MAMDYTRKTIKLLLERNPEYLNEILTNLGIRIDLSKETPDSIAMMLDYQNRTGYFNHKSSIYTCKCGSNNVITREIQTRSADEGSTIFHICQKCGHTW
jgi:DNA-directed RNA polymerase subunit M/transcription elongation factor TFIIS